MGLIQRQSIKNSLVNYLGILIGGLSTLFIYPLDWELYGEIQFSLSSAVLLGSLFSLGNFSLVNKYFPQFKSNNTKGFLTLLFFYSMANILLVAFFIFLFKTPFFQLLTKANFDIHHIQDNLFIILPIALFLVFINVLRAHVFNYGRIVFPDLITNFSTKIIIPILVLLGYFSIVDFRMSGWILVVSYLFMNIALLYYLHTLNGLDFNPKIIQNISVKKHMEMIQYMLYGALNHVGNILVYKIDIIMIGLLLSVTKVGYYSIFLFLSVIIEIPTKAVFSITSPMISTALEKKDYPHIQQMYQKSSTNLFIIGVILFIGIWFNIHTLFEIMTNGEDLILYKNVFLILGITKLIDMITSVNFHIISYSKYFRVNTLFIIILAASNILLNYYFIGHLDIEGAAISTGISMLAFNLLKTIFVAVKFKMHPFTSSTWIILLFLIIAIGLPYFAPFLLESIFTAALTTLVYLAIFVFLIYKLQLSTEINQFIIKNILSKIKR